MKRDAVHEAACRYRVYAAQYDLGARLRSYRVGNGLSLRALSERSGVPFNTISRIERGQEPGIFDALALAEAMGVSLEALLRRDCTRCGGTGREPP